MKHKSQKNPVQLPRVLSLTLALALALFGGLGPQTSSAAPQAQEIVTLPSVASQAQQSVTLPLVMGGACIGGEQPNPFAFQIYGHTGIAGGLLTEIKASGATWVRAQVDWGVIEPTNRTPAQYVWNQADYVAAGAGEGCLNVIMTHGSNAPWAANTSIGRVDKVGLEELAEYIGALVERFDGDGLADAPGSPIVTYFELYNEPDAGPIPGNEAWGNHGAAYADMLEAVYPAVKAANPNAKVVFGGIAYDGFTEDGGVFVKRFLDDVLAAGGGDFFDVMNFHQYPAYGPSWTNGGKGPGLYEKALAVRQKLVDFGVNKPLIVTETGWHNNSHPQFPSSDEIQSRYVVALMTESLAAELEITTWWPLADVGPLYQFDTGLITYPQPGQRKPAYPVFQLTVQQLKRAQYVRILPASETNDADLAVHEFLDNGQKLFVAWLNPIDQPNTPAKSLALSAEKVTVIDMLGAISTVNDTDDGSNNGRVTLAVSRPVFVRVVQ